MKLQNLERHQAWIYLAAILSGLVLGALAPSIAGVLEALLWPVLGFMLSLPSLRCRSRTCRARRATGVSSAPC